MSREREGGGWVSTECRERQEDTVFGGNAATDSVEM